jgi:hypothetical protein
MVHLCVPKVRLDICAVRHFKRVECSGCMFDALHQSKKGLFQKSASSWFLGLLLDWLSVYRSCTLGSTTCRMFRLHGESCTVVDLISLLSLERVLSLSVASVSSSIYIRSDLIKRNRLFTADSRVTWGANHGSD